MTETRFTKGPWRVSHRQESSCTIHGFTHVKVGDQPALAYVINPDDANLIAARVRIESDHRALDRQAAFFLSDLGKKIDAALAKASPQAD